jgi:hypothetical protein
VCKLGEKKSVKRKRSQQLTPSYADGSDERGEEQQEDPRSVEDIECDSKPKVKTKMEVDSESIPTIVCEPATPSDLSNLIMDPKLLVNNHKVLLEEDDESIVTTESVAGSSMKSEDDPVKTEEMIVAVESDAMESCREGVANTSVDTLSAIVNHITTDGGVVVMSDNSRTEQKVCPDDLDVEMTPTNEDVTMKSVPSSDPVVPELVFTSTSSTPSSISLAVHQVTDPSSPLSPSLELPVASPTVQQSQQQQQSEPQQKLTSLAPKGNDDPVASIIPVSEEKTQRTEQDLMSSIVKPKCEVEDAINDVKRDDYLTGNYFYLKFFCN